MVRIWLTDLSLISNFFLVGFLNCPIIFQEMRLSKQRDFLLELYLCKRIFSLIFIAELLIA